LALEAAYRAIKGSRIWVLEGDEGEEATVSSNEPAWARWLPPSPSRERILRYLRGGRAHLLTPSDGGEGEDQPPLVQFEDGGVMPLPAVRWSEDVRNFYEAGSLPHPHGLRYRGRP
ncbi:MAG TPA: hypothetical protein VFZ25_05090, partial [Chloroflexota bacterium]|nr:hypothetical protein [Chloroflexota bacterium]